MATMLKAQFQPYFPAYLVYQSMFLTSHRPRASSPRELSLFRPSDYQVDHEMAVRAVRCALSVWRRDDNQSDLCSNPPGATVSRGECLKTKASIIHSCEPSRKCQGKADIFEGGIASALGKNTTPKADSHRHQRVGQIEQHKKIMHCVPKNERTYVDNPKAVYTF